jgi:hypothetical protein
MKTIEIETPACTSIDQAAANLVAGVCAEGVDEVTTDFNGVKLTASKQSRPQDIVEFYYEVRFRQSNIKEAEIIERRTKTLRALTHAQEFVCRRMCVEHSDHHPLCRELTEARKLHE